MKSIACNKGTISIKILQKWERCILGMTFFLISVTMMTIIAPKENERHKNRIKKKGKPKYHMTDRGKNLITGSPLFMRRRYVH